MLDAAAIGKRIDTMRRKNNWSQKEFAAKLRISQPAVSTYLRDRIPPAEILLRLAELGQTTIEWILTGQKSYVLADNSDLIAEKKAIYDTDWRVTQQIAALEPSVRDALLRLIIELSGAQRSNEATSYAAE